MENTPPGFAPLAWPGFRALIGPLRSRPKSGGSLACVRCDLPVVGKAMVHGGAVLKRLRRQPAVAA